MRVWAEAKRAEVAPVGSIEAVVATMRRHADSTGVAENSCRLLAYIATFGGVLVAVFESASARQSTQHLAQLAMEQTHYHCATAHASMYIPE